jgi:hypothetical protein
MKCKTIQRSFRLFALVILATSPMVRAAGLEFLETYQGKPYHDSRYSGEAQPIPGKVQCAYYDLGGEGIAYHDSDAKNNGSGALNPADGTYLNEFRMNEGVDISYTKFHHDIDNTQYDLVKPPENQLYVGWTEPGEWFNLTVQVAQAGVYSADLLYTSNRGGSICHPAVDDCVHSECSRSDCLAAVASLERRAKPCQGEPSGGKKRSHRSYRYRRPDEPGIF